MKRNLVVAFGLVFGIVLGFSLPSILTGAAKDDPVIPREMTSYRDVVKKILPAVVSIEAKAKTQIKREATPRRPAEIPNLPEGFRKFFDELQVPFDFGEELPPMHGFGSGFVIDASGVILTNNHVVMGAEKITVEFHDGRKFVAKEIRTDPKTDLAIILIDAKNLPFLSLGDSDQMEIGDRVLAVGAPFGLVGSVTAGIVSGKGRNMQMTMYEDYVQTDAAINPGNSGGPLVNLEGKVIGINTAIKTRTGSWQGVGLAIASNIVKNVWPKLHRDGHVKRGYLGIQVRKLEQDVAARLGVPNQTGVLIAKVFENSPASKAGIKDGDVLTSIGGKVVKDGQELQRLVTELPTGKQVELRIFREGNSMTLPITIEEQPREFGITTTQPLQHDEAEGISLETLGIKVADLTKARAKQFGYTKESEGAVITYVQPGSLASEGGVERGSLILKVDNQLVRNAVDAQDAFHKGSLERGVLLQLQTPRDGISLVLLKESRIK